MITYKIKTDAENEDKVRKAIDLSLGKILWCIGHVEKKFTNSL